MKFSHSIAFAFSLAAWLAGSTSAAAAEEAKFKSGPMSSGSVKVDVELNGADGLWLIVTDAGNGMACDWADWAEPRLIREDGQEVKLTSMKWKSASAGWGSVNVNHNADGGPLKIAGNRIPFGIGTHAPSLIHYDLPEGVYKRFKAVAGLDNGGTDQNGPTKVEFLVLTQKPSQKLMQLATSGGGSGGGAMRGHGPEAAEDYLETLTVHDGLEVSLFASEPQLVNPANMDIDARGRVWVTEGANYRRWNDLRPEGDRIVILEDSNGDGRADVEKTFYQGTEINSALGICVLGNKVIVSCSPNVFVFTDTDRDDKADKKEVMFTGIGGHQHDHGVHAFVFGPDGNYYFNMGNSGRQIKRPDGSFVVDEAGNEVKENGTPYREGMVFRCNPDGSEFETLGWNFRNNYEVAVDSFGTLWQSDNDDDGNLGVRINYVMPYGNYGYRDEITGAGWGEAWKEANQEENLPNTKKPIYHWHQKDPGVVPNLLHTGAGSPTGITVYEGDLLPEVFQNQVIHCDAGPRVVRAYPVTNDGAGYEADIQNLLTSSDSWFRPSDVCVAPDGSIYVADWNDPGVGGHNMGDRNLESMRGRIYRIAPKGHQPNVPPLNLETAAGCVEALQSPNLATRYLAWNALHSMQHKAEADLQRLWQRSEPRMRARALHLLARIQGKTQSYVDQALDDENPNIRLTALRIARDEHLDMIPRVKKVAKDPSPQVRREAAIALRHNQAPEAAELWATLAQQHDGEDRWYVEALGIGANQQWDRFLTAWLNRVGDDWDTAAGRDIIWRSRSSKTPQYLVKIIQDEDTSEEERARYFRSLDFIEGPEKEAALLELVTGGN